MYLGLWSICVCGHMYLYQVDVYTGVICCVLCLNAIIFVHVLILTMQVPMIVFGASAHSPDGYPIGLDLAPLRVSWYLPRVRTKPSSFTHYIDGLVTACLYAWLCGTNFSCRYPCTNSGFLPTLGLAAQLVLGLHPYGFVLAAESAPKSRAYFCLQASPTSSKEECA